MNKKARKLVLLAVWIICILNIVFFGDIIINYLIGNTESPFSGATTKGPQCQLSLMMVLLCITIISIYTIALREPKTTIIIIKEK